MPIKTQIARNCIICDVVFTPKRCIAKCCSLVCRIKYANKQRKNIKAVWAKTHKNNIKLSQQKWLKLNPEKRKLSSATYIKKNIDYYTQYRSLRNRHMLQAKPKWANEQELRAIYREAKERGLEVDHIIPIKHPLVCGLHVPSNLQLLTRSENARKSNKFNEDILVGYIK